MSACNTDTGHLCMGGDGSEDWSTLGKYGDIFNMESDTTNTEIYCVTSEHPSKSKVSFIKTNENSALFIMLFRRAAPCLLDKNELNWGIYGSLEALTPIFLTFLYFRGINFRVLMFLVWSSPQGLQQSAIRCLDTMGDEWQCVWVAAVNDPIVHRSW